MRFEKTLPTNQHTVLVPLLHTHLRTTLRKHHLNIFVMMFFNRKSEFQKGELNAPQTNDHTEVTGESDKLYMYIYNRLESCP